MDSDRTRPFFRNFFRATFAAVVGFTILEATAALWHLALFRDFYRAETAVMDRPFDEYIVSYLMTTNAFRAAVTVFLFFALAKDGPFSYGRGARIGLGLGVISALSAAEYFGVWRFRSLAWPLVEALWFSLQGACMGLGLVWAMRFRRTSTVQ